MTTLKELNDIVERLGATPILVNGLPLRPEDEDKTAEEWNFSDAADIDQFIAPLKKLLDERLELIRELCSDLLDICSLKDQNEKLIAENLRLRTENSVNGYQAKAMRTYKPNTKLDGKGAMLLGALGLAGEAGEVVEMVKKHVFHNKPLDMDLLVKELGDVLWYLAVMARTVPNVSLGEVGRVNIQKLLERYPNGFDPQKANSRKGGR